MSRLRLALWLAALVHAATVASLSLTPPSGLPKGLGNDKLEHLLAYAILSTLAGLAAAKRPGLARRLAVVVAGCLAFGMAIECLQPLVGRTFDLRDMAANALGVLLGTAASAGAARRLARRRGLPDPATGGL